MSDRASRIRDEGRDARLSFRNFAEYRVRSEFKDDAIQKCAPQMRAFAECAQENGLAVIFMCRSLNKAITECMYVHNSDEAFAKHLEENPGLLEQRSISVAGGVSKEK